MTLLNQLNVLESAGLVHSAQTPPRAEYLFRHAIIQEAAYATVLKADRRVLHCAVGQAIETSLATRLDEFASTLAFHYERGQDWAAALHWLSRAADRAYAQWALFEAIDLYQRALAVLKQLPDRAAAEFDLRFKLAQAMMFAGIARYETQAEFDRALALALTPHQQAEVYYQMGRLLHIFTSSDLAAAEKYYTQSLELLSGHQQDEWYCTVLAYLGYLYRYQQRTAQSIETLERALELAKQIHSIERQADTHIFLSGAYLDADREDDALSAGLRGYELAKELGNLELIGRAHSFCTSIYLSRAYAGRGSADEALPHINEMRRHGREYGTAVLAGFGAQGLAAYHELEGDRSAALENWRESVDIWLRSRAPTRAAWANSKCGQMLLELGSRPAALEAFELVKQNLGPVQLDHAEFYIGLAYAGAGFDQEACAHLQTAFDTTDSLDLRRSWVNLLRTDPEFTQHRSLPGVAAVLDRVEVRP